MIFSLSSDCAEAGSLQALMNCCLFLEARTFRTFLTTRNEGLPAIRTASTFWSLFLISCGEEGLAWTELRVRAYEGLLTDLDGLDDQGGFSLNVRHHV